MAFRSIRDVWRRFRNFGNPELEELKGRLIQLKGDVEKLQQIRKLQAEHEEKILLFQLRKVVQAFAEAEKAINEEAKKVRKSVTTIEDEVKMKFTERKTARIMANTEHLLRTVDVGKFLAGVPLEECMREAPNPSPSAPSVLPPIPSVTPAAEAFTAAPGSSNPSPSAPPPIPSVTPVAEGFTAALGSSNPGQPTTQSTFPVEGQAQGEAPTVLGPAITLSREEGPAAPGIPAAPTLSHPELAEPSRPAVVESFTFGVNTKLSLDVPKEVLGHDDSSAPEISKDSTTTETDMPEGGGSHGGATWSDREGSGDRGDGEGQSGVPGDARGFPGEGMPSGSQGPPAGGVTSASARPGGIVMSAHGDMTRAAATSAAIVCAGGLASSAHGHAPSAAATSAAIAWRGNAVSAPITSDVTATSAQDSSGGSDRVIPLPPLGRPTKYLAPHWHGAETRISGGDIFDAFVGFPAHFGEVYGDETGHPTFSVTFAGPFVGSDLVPAGCPPPAAVAVRAPAETGVAVQGEVARGVAVPGHGAARDVAVQHEVYDGVAVHAGAPRGLAVPQDVPQGIAVQQDRARGVAVQGTAHKGVALHVDASGPMMDPAARNDVVAEERRGGPWGEGGVQRREGFTAYNSTDHPGDVAEGRYFWREDEPYPHGRANPTEGPDEQRYFWREQAPAYAGSPGPAAVPAGRNFWRDDVSAYAGVDPTEGPLKHFPSHEEASPQGPASAHPPGDPAGQSAFFRAGPAAAGRPSASPQHVGGGARWSCRVVSCRVSGPAGVHVWSSADPTVRTWTEVSPPTPGASTGKGVRVNIHGVNIHVGGGWYAKGPGNPARVDAAPRNPGTGAGEGFGTGAHMGGVWYAEGPAHPVRHQAESRFGGVSDGGDMPVGTVEPEADVGGVHGVNRGTDTKG